MSLLDLDINNSTEEKKLEYKNAKQSNHRLRKLFNLENTTVVYFTLLIKTLKHQIMINKNREDLNAKMKTW